MKNNIKNKTSVLIACLLALTSVILWSCDDTDYIVLPDPIEQLTISSLSAAEGPIGSELIITGSNFSLIPSNNKVLFNDVAGIVQSASNTELFVEVPNAVASGELTSSVTVTVSHGQFSADAGNFIIFKPIVILVIPLTDNDDDVEEVAVDFGAPVGTMDLGSSDLEFGEISSGQGLMNIGLRFNNVTVAQGSSINEANIQFKCDDTGSNPVEVTIYGENTANAVAYTGTDGELSARPLTTANIVWTIPEWVTIGDRTDAQKTVDLASIIQEIVNRADWVSGNSINIIMKHTGVSVGASSSSDGREAENYSSSAPDDGAELTIVYQ